MTFTFHLIISASQHTIFWLLFVQEGSTMKGLCYCWGVQEFKVSMYPSTSPTVPRLLPWERTSGSGAFCCFQKLSQGCIQDTHTLSCVPCCLCEEAGGAGFVKQRATSRLILEPGSSPAFLSSSPLGSFVCSWCSHQRRPQTKGGDGTQLHASDVIRRLGGCRSGTRG